MNSMSSSSKFLLLACLYFSQGLPYGFFTQALPGLMRMENASLPEIGLTSLLALPWALKFLWAPIIDFTGRKKYWILGMQFCAVVLFVALGFASRSGGYAYLVYGFFLANLISATQDIASDGLAVGLLSPHERGVGNGLQVAGYRLGMVFGGGFILMIIAQLQWQGAFFVMGLAMSFATIPLIFYKEPILPRPSKALLFRQMLKDFVLRKDVGLWLVVIGFYKFGDSMTSKMLVPYLMDTGYSMADIGKLLGTVGFVSGLLGAIAGGLAVRAWGRYQTVVLFGVIQAGGVFGYYLLTVGVLSGDPALWMVTAVEHFTGGLATAALFTTMMDVCRKDTSAFDYTLQASVVVIATGIAKALSGYMAAILGYQGNFLLSGVLCLCGAGLFASVYFRQREDPNSFSLAWA